MIIATAGHVDHGKTSLIRQLTGVETDRLAEEKRRGLSINLGYAYLPREEGPPLGFIDVPGHQRFINNMISGISGIDMGMLVIAADDGPMPQTHEHLDVLQLLGIEQLVVVLSKTDKVPSGHLSLVREELAALVTKRHWPDARCFPVSNIDGTGIAELKAHLLKCASECTSRSSRGYFRLSIDRAFTAKGAGLIVTGTASAGSIAVGDTLTLLPQGVELRLRGIRVHDQKAERAAAGQRCALNVVGKLEAAAINRGDWLVEPGAASPTSRLDVNFTLLESAPFPLKHLSPVKMYIGAKRVPGRIALLDTGNEGNRLLPGSECLAQLILESAVSCFRGERFLLRDHAENVILGGGIVLDPEGPPSGKSRPQRIAELNAMQSNSPAAALVQLLGHNRLVDLNRFLQVCNLRERELDDRSLANFHRFESEGRQWIVSPSRREHVDAALLAHVDRWHLEQPQLQGIKVTELKSALGESCESPLLIAVLTARLRSGALTLHEGRIRRSSFQPAIDAEASAHWEIFQQLLQRCGKNIPLLSEVCKQTGVETKTLDKVAKTAVKSGRLHSVSGQRYALPGELYELAKDIIAQTGTGEPITAAAVKSRFGVGRNLTIEILEYFDRIHFTQRRGDHRVVLDAELPARLFSK